MEEAARAATTEQKKAAFEAGLFHVLQSWTVLSLAVEHSWGGRQSARKREDIYKALLQCFYSPSEALCLGKRRVTGSAVTASDENLADYLIYQMEVNFHVECEDEDDYLELARVMRRLAATLKAGDFSFYEKILQTAADGHLKSVSQCPIAQMSLYAPQAAPAVDDASSSDSESDYAQEEDIIAQAEQETFL